MASNKYYEKQDNGVSLEWKKHDEYFDIYSQTKQEFNALYSLCMMDLSQIPKTFAKLFEFIGHIKGQLLMKMTAEEIRDHREKLLNLMQKNDKIKVLSEMERFYDEVISICRELELEPKPEELPIDEIRTEKDDKIRAALIAYKLIYDE